MKYKLLCCALFFVSCQTPHTKSACQHDHISPVEHSQAETKTEEEPLSPNLTSEQILELASQLLNNDAPEQALELINTIPTEDHNLQSKKIKREAINNIVMNLRYKVRVLYEKAIQQDSKEKKLTLLQCKQILEIISKNYPEYDDMYAVKNNLKQIERTLAKKL